MRFVEPATGGRWLRVLRVPDRNDFRVYLYLRGPRPDFAGVSLNRYEQLLLDYIQSQPDESDFWEVQVKALQDSHPAHLARVHELNRLLWAYFVERGGSVPSFAEITGTGDTAISMRNLAEFLIERWSPRPRRRSGIKPGGPA